LQFKHVSNLCVRLDFSFVIPDGGYEIALQELFCALLEENNLIPEY
jgi:hypothetical protein